MPRRLEPPRQGSAWLALACGVAYGDRAPGRGGVFPIVGLKVREAIMRVLEGGASCGCPASLKEELAGWCWLARRNTNGM